MEPEEQQLPGENLEETVEIPADPEDVAIIEDEDDDDDDEDDEELDDDDDDEDEDDDVEFEGPDEE